MLQERLLRDQLLRARLRLRDCLRASLRLRNRLRARLRLRDQLLQEEAFQAVRYLQAQEQVLQDILLRDQLLRRRP